MRLNLPNSLYGAIAFLLICCGSYLVSCGRGTTDKSGVLTQRRGAMTLEKFSIRRDKAPDVSDSEVTSLVKGQTAFAIDLFKKLATNAGNSFFSPYSISNDRRRPLLSPVGERSRRREVKKANIERHPR